MIELYYTLREKPPDRTPAAPRPNRRRKMKKALIIALLAMLTVGMVFASGAKEEAPKAKEIYGEMKENANELMDKARVKMDQAKDKIEEMKEKKNQQA